MRERHLQWVQKNRSRRTDYDRISTLLDGFMRSDRMTRMHRQCLLVDTVELEAGPELMRVVEWLEQRGDTLILRVKNTADCYTLGIRWQRRLLRALQRQVPSMGVREIRFLPVEMAANRRV